MDQPVYAPFKGAIEPPARPPATHLRANSRLLVSISLGLAVVILAVTAIVTV